MLIRREFLQLPGPPVSNTPSLPGKQTRARSPSSLSQSFSLLPPFHIGGKTIALSLLLLLAPAWAREGVFLAAGVGHLEGLSLLFRGAALEVGVALPPPALGLGLLVPFSASELAETYWGAGATLRPGEGFLAFGYLGFRWGKEVGQDLFWQLAQALLGREVFLPLRGFVETGAGAGLRGGRPAVAWHLRVGFALLEGPPPAPVGGLLHPPPPLAPPGGSPFP